MIRRFVHSVLSHSGYNVVDADTAEEALRMIEANPDVKLLVTDVMMPDVNGCELAIKMRERQPRLRVLFMSGYESGLLATASVPGAAFLPKPFGIPDLIARVKQILA